jgi:hypothetical protein
MDEVVSAKGDPLCRRLLRRPASESGRLRPGRRRPPGRRLPPQRANVGYALQQETQVHPAPAVGERRAIIVDVPLKTDNEAFRQTACQLAAQKQAEIIAGVRGWAPTAVLQRSWPGTRRHARSRAADRCCRVQSAAQPLGSGHSLALPHMIETGQVTTRQSLLFRHTSGACGLTTVTGRPSQTLRQSSDIAWVPSTIVAAASRRGSCLHGQDVPSLPTRSMHCTRGVV